MGFFHYTRFCQIIWQISREEQIKFIKKIVPSGVGTEDLQIISLMLYQLS